MSYVKIWVHAVWGTKWHHPFLQDGLRAEVIRHIMENAAVKGIEINIINGWVDHVHCLIRLQPKQSVAEVIKLIKGELSHWINKHDLTTKKFAWGREYYAASVSEGNLNLVKRYIQAQERHHAKRTYMQEVEAYFATLSLGDRQEYTVKPPD